MRKLIPLVIVFAFWAHASMGQIVGSNCFLQGRYVEAGFNPYFGCGAATSPLTYHSLTAAGTGVPVPGNQLGLVYDLGHDGWNVGTPNATGDYVMPGLPSDGWVLEVAGAQATVNHPGTSATGSLSVTGSITGYTNSGGTATAFWDGVDAGGSLGIHMESKIDTNASAMVMTVKLRNLSAAPLTNIYFMRYCDPDNLSWNGGASSTQNTIVYQQGDALNRAFVNSATTTPYVSNFSLGAVDSRAKVATLASLVPTASVSASYTAGTGTVLSAAGSTSFADQGICIMFSLGTINAGDSTQLSYAYIFNGVPGFDSVFFPCGVLAGGTVTPDNDTICGTMPLLLGAAGYSTGSGITYQWQSSPDSATWTNIAGATSVPYTVSSSSLTLYYRLVSTCTSAGSSVQSPGVRVVYQPLCPCASVVAGTASASVSTGCATTAITLNATGYTSTGVTYRWQSSTDSATWSDIPGATSIPYSFTGITTSTYYRLVVTCATSSPEDSTAGVLISFVSCACPGLTAGMPSSSVPMACTTTSVTLNASGYTSTGATYQWQSSPDGTSWTDIAGATSIPYSFTGITATTHYRLVVTCTASGATAMSAGIVVTYTSVCGCVPLTAGVVSSSTSAACSTTVVTLSASGYTSTGTTIRWQASYDNVNWTDLPVTSASYIFTGLGVTTYYRLKVTCVVSGDTVVSAGKIINWYSCPPTTSVGEHTGADIRVYPNPANGHVTVEVPQGGYTNLIIVNALGQEVVRQNIASAKTKVDVASLPAGVYQMQLRGEKGSQVLRILKL